jgi:hypothetical protein
MLTHLEFQRFSCHRTLNVGDCWFIPVHRQEDTYDVYFSSGMPPLRRRKSMRSCRLPRGLQCMLVLQGVGQQTGPGRSAGRTDRQGLPVSEVCRRNRRYRKPDWYFLINCKGAHL